MTNFGLSTALFRDGRLGARQIALVAEHGFRAIELTVAAGHFDLVDAAQVRDVRDRIGAAGLSIAGVSVPFGEAAAAARILPDLGCSLLIARGGGCRADSPAGGARPDDFAFLRRAAPTLAEALTGSDVSLVLDLPVTGATPETVADWLDSLEDAVGGVCFDAGHAHLQSGAPETAEALGGFMLTAHLHDNNGREDSHRVPFSGSVDWPATLMACWKTGYAGPWILDVAAGEDVTATLARAVSARTRLQAILDDLAQPIAFVE